MIYSLFLLMVLFFLLVRGRNRPGPRSSMYQVLLGFGGVLDLVDCAQNQINRNFNKITRRKIMGDEIKNILSVVEKQVQSKLLTGGSAIFITI